MSACTVCAHPDRAEIDMQLARQVLNVSELARRYGLGHDAVGRHRARHMPTFLPAFSADAQAREPGTIRAEAERLYLITLDALAAAEAGVVTEIAPDGTVVREVSPTHIARLVREARAGLDLMTKLALRGDTGDVAPAGVNAELDSRLTAALDRIAARSLTATSQPVTTDPPRDVAEAEILDPDAARRSPLSEPARGAVGGPHTTHPTTLSGQGPPPSRASVGVPNLDVPTQTPQGVLNDLRAKLGPKDAARLDAVLAGEPIPTVVPDAPPQSAIEAPKWDGNPAASEEERRAAGFGALPLTWRGPDELDPDWINQLDG